MRIRKLGPVDDVLKDEDILTAAKVADALAHPARIRMLRYILTENLARNTVTNKDLVLAFDYAQATISQHLSKLLVGGLLDVRKKGTSSCYFARVGRLSIFTETLKKIETHTDPGDMPDFLRSGFYNTNDDEGLGEYGDELQPEFFDESADYFYDEIPRSL